MENLGEILKKKAIPANTSRANTDTWSSAENEEEELTGSTCPLCKGAGFVYPRSASGYPDFSRVVPCQCIRGELQKGKIANLKLYSNLGPLSRLSFDNLLPTGRDKKSISQQDFSQAYEAAKSFTDTPKGWLILIGPGGCGKTHLACAIVNQRLSLGQPAIYMGSADLLDHLRSTFSPDSNITYDELFERIKNTPLLALDDLTMSATTPWARGKLEHLLTHRFNTQLPTVITTDVPIEDFEDNLRSYLTDPELCQAYVIQKKLLFPLEHLGSLELELLRKMSFKNFDCKRLNLPFEERQNLEQAFHVAHSFAQSPDGWLVFMGVNGCGKTHLAAAIANHLLQADKEVLFIVVPDLLDHLRSTFIPDSRVTYDELFEKVKKSPMLILDDFGEQAATPWAQEKLYQLINYRYNARLATVITTCFSLEDIETRISSRMVDPSLSLVFNIMAPDYRGDIRATQKAKSRQRYSRQGQ